MPELLVVGSLAYDDIETPVASGKRLLGGSLSHFALAASLAGAAPRLVAVVGDDFDEADLSLLEISGADLAGVERRGGATFRWGGKYGENFVGRETLFTELGVFADFNPTLTPEYRDSELIFLANIQPELQSRVLDQAGAPALVALDTMNLWIDCALDDLRAVIKRVDLLFINDEEARQLSGEPSLMRAGEALRAMGPESVLLKKGEHGVLLFTGGQVYPCPGFPVADVVDPTGAGDAFAGGVMGHLAREGRWDAPALRRALLTGSVAGSFAVEGLSVEGLSRRSREDFAQRRRNLEGLLVPPGA